MTLSGSSGSSDSLASLSGSMKCISISSMDAPAAISDARVMNSWSSGTSSRPRLTASRAPRLSPKWDLRRPRVSQVHGYSESSTTPLSQYSRARDGFPQYIRALAYL